MNWVQIRVKRVDILPLLLVWIDYPNIHFTNRTVTLSYLQPIKVVLIRESWQRSYSHPFSLVLDTFSHPSSR